VKFTQQKGATGVRIQASLQLQAIKATDTGRQIAHQAAVWSRIQLVLTIPVTFLGAVKHAFGACGDDGRRACL
jgi:hypothetical protein